MSPAGVLWIEVYGYIDARDAIPGGSGGVAAPPKPARGVAPAGRGLHGTKGQLEREPLR